MGLWLLVMVLVRGFGDWGCGIANPYISEPKKNKSEESTLKVPYKNLQSGKLSEKV